MENQTQPTTNNTLSIQSSQFKIIMTMVLVALSFWSSFTSLFDSETPFILKFILLPTTLLTGYILYFLFMKLYKKIPSLVIDEKGIYDDVLPISIDQITWDEIKGIEVYKYETEIPFFEQQYLGIEVNDPETFKKKLNFVQEKLFKINHWFPKLKGQINIPIYLLDSNADIIVKHIKAFHPEKIVEEEKK